MRKCESGFHQQLDNDLMYFRFLMANNLQQNLIFGRVGAGDIVWLRIGVKYRKIYYINAIFEK